MFSQAFSTPPIQEEWISIIWYNAWRERGKQILENTFILPVDTQVCIAKMVKKLKMLQIVKKKGLISTITLIYGHVGGWKKQNKIIVSVRTELTFNDFKVKSQVAHIAKLDYSSRQIPFEKGFSPEGYKKVVDFQILKSKGIWSRDNENNIFIFGTFQYEQQQNRKRGDKADGWTKYYSRRIFKFKKT